MLIRDLLIAYAHMLPAEQERVLAGLLLAQSKEEYTDFIKALAKEIQRAQQDRQD